MPGRLVAIFVRHGSTELNDSNKFRGPLDIDLDDNGRKQAEDVREVLRNRPFGPVAFTSSKSRTKETADIVLQGRDVQRRALPNLDALNVGTYAGQPKTVSNRDELDYYQRNLDAKIPGGERIGDFRKRVDPELEMIVRRGDESGIPVIAFVHSSIIHEIGQLYHGNHNHVTVKPGGIVGVYKTPNGYEAEALFRETKKDENLAS